MLNLNLPSHPLRGVDRRPHPWRQCRPSGVLREHAGPSHSAARAGARWPVAAASTDERLSEAC